LFCWTIGLQLVVMHLLQSVYGSLTFISTLKHAAHFLCLFSLLLLKQLLHLFLFLPKIFILKLEHVDVFEVEVETLVGLHQFNLVCNLLL